MKELKNDIKTGQFKRVYLLYGEEKYLLRHYERQIREKLVSPVNETMNLDIFDGKSASADTIADACSTLPFMCEQRLVIVRGSTLLCPGRKDDTEKLTAFITEIPETTVLLFVEDSIDKRSRLYKKITDLGKVCEFKYPTEKELVSWAQNVCGKHGKNISQANAALLLRTAAHSMEAVNGELDKLAAYTGERKEITREDIEAICTKSLEAKIFDLVDAVGGKRADSALVQFNSLLIMKEQPIMILSMIARQFRLILYSKMLSEDGMSSDKIASTLSIRSFVAGECMRQARNFSGPVLLEALEDCADADMNIKSGRMNDRLAVETLIIKYAG